MRLSDDRINHLAHMVAYAIDDAEGVKFHKDLNKIRVLIKNIIERELSLEDKLAEVIHKRLRSQSKVIENTADYEIQFEQEFQKELKKHRPAD